mgnify:FL=1
MISVSWVATGEMVEAETREEAVKQLLIQAPEQPCGWAHHGMSGEASNIFQMYGSDLGEWAQGLVDRGHYIHGPFWDNEGQPWNVYLKAKFEFAKEAFNALSDDHKAAAWSAARYMSTDLFCSSRATRQGMFSSDGARVLLSKYSPLRLVGVKLTLQLSPHDSAYDD